LFPRKQDETHIKRMAELLKSGATMTDLACPACASPLFRLKNGDLWCERDQKKVVVVKEGEEARLTQNSTLNSLEATLSTKVQEIQEKMAKEQDPEKLQKLGNTLTGLLENLERTRKMKRA
jgi:uncharacterized Zn finger protein (UPF0148 family)